MTPMLPIYLFIDGFFCLQQSEINFTNFQSALVLGRMDGNPLKSNGTGKTTIFRAIEFVLFGQVRDPLMQKDIILDRLISDEAHKVVVVFDFSIGNETFRISRSRTKKGITDLSFYRLKSDHSVSPHTTETNKELWEDISSRRTQDTEADLAKIIKCSYRSFLHTNHFMQGDLSGIAMATPEKRRAILRETLVLVVYSKLEELAKIQADLLLKRIEKDRLALTLLGNPQRDLLLDQQSKQQLEGALSDRNTEISSVKQQLAAVNEQQIALSSRINLLSSQSGDILTKRGLLTNDINKLNASLSEYGNKRKSIVSTAKKLNAEIVAITKEQGELGSIDDIQLIVLKQELFSLNQQKNEIEVKIGVLNAEIADCLIPLPADGTCKHCRQILSPEHRQSCAEKNARQLSSAELEKTNCAAAHSIIRRNLSLKEKEINTFEQRQIKIAVIEQSLIAKNKELHDSKQAYTEYQSLIENWTSDLAQKQQSLSAIEIEIGNSSATEVNQLREQLQSLKKQMDADNRQLEIKERAVKEVEAKLAVSKHTIQQKETDIGTKLLLEQNIVATEAEYVSYPDVIKAFSPSGIPNLIIQNLLEDLQSEVNNLLSQIRPGLQLSFSTEKTRSDGEIADTLDINYFLNNKPRDYSVLSGAQRLCIAFSLKLGLSFLLANMMGSQIKFLLLDEVDASLDPSSADAFADIVKMFQKEFKILVITHNDRLKDKFNTIILVEQDQNMISRARVISS
jgi:DNA repair exonuclease SbcCD ATPase subunit